MPRYNRSIPGWLPRAKRPRCRNCGGLIRPFVWLDFVHTPTEDGIKTTARATHVTFPGFHAVFCRPACAADFGLAAFICGYRRAGR